jgi:MFS transporter, DHA2 family, multidrug resistance protein
LNVKLIVALAGIIVAALSTELNGAVSGLLLNDIGGSLGFTHDPGTWFTSLYTSAEVFGMATSPWFSVTFSMRRWALFVIALTAVSTILIPCTSTLAILYVLRGVQGLCGGLAIPLLMTVALRALPPAIRPFGLAAYSTTATFFPNLATSLAALWQEAGDGKLGWQFGFYEAVPLAILAACLVWWGMPRDPIQLGRLRLFDWRGSILLVLGFGSFTTMLLQGDRLDWFNSVTICVLAAISAAAIPAFLVNEWFHPLPFFQLRLLKRRNLAFALIAFFTFLVITLGASTLPVSFLTEVAHFRPLQVHTITLLLALLQLVLLPLAAVLINQAWVDARFLMFTGLLCMGGAAAANSLLTSDWEVGEFVICQVLNAVGEAFVVMTILLFATNSVVPQEGPFVSGLFNTPRGVAEATGTWLVQLIERWRGGLHANRIADQLGQERFLVPGAGAAPTAAPIAQAQGAVLTLSDAFVVMCALCVFLTAVLWIVPRRTYPPRIVFAQR